MLRLSIIIPCFNMGHFLPDAVNSVREYKGNDVEVIIVNDGSNESATLKILDQFRSEGINVIDQTNQGLSAARNKGVAVSKGPYFLPLDADNKVRPAYIEKGIKILDSDDKIGIVYADANLFGEKQGKLRSMPFNLRKILVYNYIDACVVARKSAWEEVNGYDPNISPVADWDFNISVAEAGWKLHYIPEVLFDYRIVSNSMIRTFKNAKYCEDYVARKHGPLYRQYFKQQVRLMGKIRYFFPDLWDSVIGRR